MDGVPEASYWAVLPAKVRYDDTLRPNAKLLYAEITSLTYKTGFCWAKNSYFAELFSLAERTVSDLIGTLEARGYIFVEVINYGGRVERRIYTDRLPQVADNHIAKNSYVPPGQRFPPNVDENGPQDNHIAKMAMCHLAKICYPR